MTDHDTPTWDALRQFIGERTNYWMGHNQLAEIIDMVRDHPDAEFDALEAERDNQRACYLEAMKWVDQERKSMQSACVERDALAAECARIRECLWHIEHHAFLDNPSFPDDTQIVITLGTARRYRAALATPEKQIGTYCGIPAYGKPMIDPAAGGGTEGTT